MPQFKMLILSCYTSKMVAVLIFLRAMMLATNMQTFKNIARATKITKYLFESTFFWDTRYLMYYVLYTYVLRLRHIPTSWVIF